MTQSEYRRDTSRPASALDLARSAFFDGDDDRVIEILDRESAGRSRSERVDAAFLRARTLLRTHAAAEALEALDAVVKDTGDGDERMLFAVLRGTAVYRSGARSEGLQLLRDAGAESARAHPVVRAEAAYFLAEALLGERRLDEAERVLDTALDESTDIVHARILGLIGDVEVARERYAIAARHYSDALDALKRAQNHDALLQATLLHSSTIVALETLDLRLARRLVRDVDAMNWSEGLATLRFRVLENLGWIAMLEGDLIEAWRLFDENVVEALDGAYAARARVALAALLRVAGDRFGPARLLEESMSEISAFTWESSDRERQVVLLTYAVEATRLQTVMPKTGRSYVEAASDALARYARLAKRGDGRTLEDRRLEAYAIHAEGIVVAAHGDRKTATQHLERALAIWRELGYRMRVAQTALDLFRLTSDERYLDTVDTVTQTIPQSWLRREFDALRHGGANRARNLTPAERRVMLAICEGKTSKQIAEEFGRSENTIRNQTKRVFATMQVNTRAALVAECARFGLLPSDAGV